MSDDYDSSSTSSSSMDRLLDDNISVSSTSIRTPRPNTTKKVNKRNGEKLAAVNKAAMSDRPSSISSEIDSTIGKHTYDKKRKAWVLNLVNEQDFKYYLQGLHEKDTKNWKYIPILREHLDQCRKHGYQCMVKYNDRYYNSKKLID